MQKRLSFLIFLPLLSTLLPTFAFAQVQLEDTLICGIPATRSEATKMKDSSSKEIKNALLIANNNYGGSIPNLEKPVTEARDLKRALESIGFNVIIVENANRESMEDALLNFRKKCEKEGGIAFFHYGGHAVQIDGVLYLIPVSTKVEDATEASVKCVNVGNVMKCMQGDANVIVFDTARNNPFPPENSGSSKRRVTGFGTSKNRFPDSSIVVYSAESDAIPLDGVFTPILIEHITEKNVNVEDLLSKVCREVSKKTEGKQNPCVYSQMLFHIYLAGKNKYGIKNSNILLFLLCVSREKTLLK